jgi:hypothetical protein
VARGVHVSGIGVISLDKLNLIFDIRDEILTRALGYE